MEDYIAESKNFLTLLSTISTCDEVLQRCAWPNECTTCRSLLTQVCAPFPRVNRMESMLSGFQADLGNISEEIKYLQEQSSSMSVKLRNRKVWPTAELYVTLTTNGHHNRL